MGQTLSQEIERKEENKEYKEAAMLRKREGAMRQKYEEKKAKLYIDALNDECLPIVCAVDSFYEFLFDVIKKPEDPEKPEESIHFGIENRMKKHLHDTDLTEFLSLLKAVLDQILAQSTEVVEERHTHVVYANKSVLRIDYYLYFHTFSDGKNTLLYFVQVGVIDIARARLPVLIYELTRATNSNTLRATGNKLEDIAKSSIHLYQAMQILADATRGRGAGGGGKGQGVDGGHGGGGGPTSPDPKDPQRQLQATPGDQTK